MTAVRWLWWAAWFALAACGPADDALPPDTGPMCTIDRVKQAPAVGGVSKVYFGTLAPTTFDLSSRQMLAIGRVDLWGSGAPAVCSGTLITTRWVLTAKHCTADFVAADIRFAIGHGSDASEHAFTVSAVREHPSADVALLELSETVTDRVADVVPIRLLTNGLDDSWIGKVVEAAGYGETEADKLGTRYFAAEPIVDFVGDQVWVDGQGEHGLCSGDSGGPLLTEIADGSVRVIGELRAGDPSCVGTDYYTRVDLYREWIEAQVGPTPDTDDVDCGSVTRAGVCSVGAAVFCGSDRTIQTQECTALDPCGWSSHARAFRCVTLTTDPCGGYDGVGVCEGGVAKACVGGALQTADCAQCGLVCRQDDARGANCVEPPNDPCDGLDRLGRCTGSIAEWCVGGAFRSRDCGAEGLSCAWRGARNGYYCQ